ncbi:MAG: rRNA maturation RNase YbeY [Patescibacteria group bacterium]
MKKLRYKKNKIKHNFTISIYNLSGKPIPIKWRREVIRLVKRCFLLSKVLSVDVSLIFIKPGIMRQLNLIYRRINKVTDVLSFLYQVNRQGLDGEIFICLTQAKVQAVRYRHALAKEIYILAIHGALHLAGYDHKLSKQYQVMNSLQQKVLN